MNSSNNFSLISNGATSGSISVDPKSGVTHGITVPNTSGYASNGISISGYPYYSYGAPYISYTPPTIYDIQVRKVENGWVVMKSGKEYIITKPEEILQYFQENQIVTK